MGNLDKVYASLPVWGQNFAVSMYGYYWHWLRFGSGYEKYLKTYRDKEFFVESDWKKWQAERLQQILKNAAQNIPYYQNNWTEAQKKAASLGRLDQLPLLEKDPIRKNPRDFLSKAFKPKKELIFHTSGSTGTPIKSIWTIPELRNSLALREARSAGWAGVSFKMPRVTFSGRMVEPNPKSRGPFYRWNEAEKQVYLSAFHLRPDTAIDYVEAINKHQIQWGTGYAHSFYLLAKHIIDQRLKVSGLKAIITTSEKLEPQMKQIMEEAYQCKVYEEYSTVENVLFASECEAGCLHVSPDVAVVEILRNDGSACAPGETGEVVTTCLIHDYQVFVRYRLGDIAAWSEKKCSCGREMPVLKEVTGRLEDVIIGSDGRQMVRFHGIFIDIPKIVEGQVVQTAVTSINLKLVVSESLSEKEEQLIRNRFYERLGRVAVIIEYVKEIPRGKNGKFKAVVNLIEKHV